MGQSLPWLVAAVLVVVGSGLIAVWLNVTAANADRDTLRRGADAINSSVEEQIRILEMAGSGTLSLSGQSLENLDLQEMVSKIDISVLTSLLDVVQYPMDESGAGDGDYLLVGIQSGRDLDIDLPVIDLTWDEFQELLDSGDAFFSAPFPTTDPDRLDYLVAIPSMSNGEGSLVGVLFRPDRMLQSAMEAAGEDQYAVWAVDTRYDNQVIVEIGTPLGDLEERRCPEGVKTALELVVRPGEGFPFAQSPWIPGLVIGTGFAIALLLMLMGRMARSRAAELAERLRLAQELNESKDRFLATVSHELRTPLTVVLGVAEEVGPNWDRFDLDERQELMTMMTDQATEAANIVEDLLVAARSDPSQLRLALEDTHLLGHVDYALASLPKEGKERVVSYAADYPIYADTTRLRQILRNILENAVRYGGPEISIDCESSGSAVRIIVSDNGDQLAPQDVERIFEPYEQSHETSDSPVGVGIGLYVSRLLAQLMGGDLDCVREHGLTRFRLTLPLTRQQPRPVAAEPVAVR